MVPFTYAQILVAYRLGAETWSLIFSLPMYPSMFVNIQVCRFVEILGTVLCSVLSVLFNDLEGINPLIFSPLSLMHKSL